MTETQTRLTEDELAAAITNALFDEDTTWKPEVHYNHYGDRGVVDLVEERSSDGYSSLRIYELKCAAAIDEVSGANDILRQFNRHRSYFFKGTDYKATDWDEVGYELAFAATEKCYNHVMDNWAQYKHVVDSKEERIYTKVLFRHENASNPIIPCEGGVYPSPALEKITGFDPEVIE